MAGSSRQKCLKRRRVEALACFVVSAFVSLSVCLAPGLNEGSEKEVCGGEVELNEGVLANPTQKRVRERREDHSHRPWSSVNTASECLSVTNSRRAIIGHRLMPDLLAPLIC